MFYKNLKYINTGNKKNQVLTFNRFSIDIALAFLPWLFGSFSLAAIVLIYWIKRNDIVKHVCAHAEWWNNSTDGMFKKATERRTRMIFGAWILSAIVTLVNSTYIQVLRPGGAGFMSTYFLNQ